MERFSRTEKLLGPEKLEKLKNSKVVLFGAGAVGSFAAEALVRSGVGNITIVDFDTICISNINRQLFALQSTIGKPKTEVALKRLSDINPACNIIQENRFADAGSIPEILSDKPDVVIDAIDSVGPKTELLAYSYLNEIPVLSSMGAARRSDPLAVKVGDLFDTVTCPLARLVRKSLKRRGITQGIKCVYSTEFPAHPVKQKLVNEESGGEGRPVKFLGSLPTVTGVFGLVLASEAIKILTE